MKCFRKATIGVCLFVFSFGVPPLGGAEGSPKGETPSLSPEGQKLFERGKEVYELTCLACHQANGMGQDALAPPLVNAHWVTNSQERLIRIALQGMRGPVTVHGKVYEMEMPPLGVLDDEQLAAVLTYVRQEWGHTASAVSVDSVKKIREATSKREEPWTEAELLKIP